MYSDSVVRKETLRLIVSNLNSNKNLKIKEECVIMSKEEQIKEILKQMNETLDNQLWKELLEKYHNLKNN